MTQDSASSMLPKLNLPQRITDLPKAPFIEGDPYKQGSHSIVAVCTLVPLNLLQGPKNALEALNRNVRLRPVMKFPTARGKPIHPRLVGAQP